MKQQNKRTSAAHQEQVTLINVCACTVAERLKKTNTCEVDFTFKRTKNMNKKEIKGLMINVLMRSNNYYDYYYDLLFNKSYSSL